MTGAVVALAGVLALSGCGTRFQDDAGDDPTVQQDVTLTYWAAWSEGEPQQVIMDAIIEDFTAETGVEVDVQYMGRQVTQSLINALATGEGPDLFDAGTRNIMDFQARGFLADLDPLLDREVPGEGVPVSETIADSVIESSQADGKLAILPTYINSNAIWFNAGRFPELRETPPQTWDELIALFDEHKAQGLVPIGADGTVSGYNVFWIFQSLVQLGGPGTMRELAEDTANWDAPEVLEAAKRVQQLVEGGYLDDTYMGSKYPDAQNRWANDEYSFMLNGSYMGGETTDQQAEGFEADTFLFPGEGDNQVIEVTANGLAVSADTEEMDAALDFLSYAAKSDHQTLWSTEAGFIGARSDVEPPASLISLYEHIQQADPDQVTGAHDLAAATHPQWWNDIFLPANDALFSGELTAEAFIARGKEDTATFLGSDG
ncbi:ABC transporter substrate-binding protein [Tessaracoccus rhinocerotis]|uniref:ABC transporter substrate-binding protein n=1 Tax=Tessaracoccus rhinocerotis TaxID=1689449 RepID=UPI00163D6346|nr:extracellular solute-binding protein [Tessaracoccus rhinocerotis]